VLRTATAADGDTGTYGWKHRVEDWAAQRGRPIYIPEEDFVLAAILLGVSIARHPDLGVVVGLRPDQRQHMNAAPEEVLSELGQAALEYVRAGWYVFPLAAGSKVPTKSSAGFKDATRDENRVRMWWRNMPNANIGIACGATKLTVIDIDRHKVDGFASLAEFERRHGALPVTLTSCTPNDGEHRFYFEPDFAPLKNSAAGEFDLAGVDIRGTDGYVVAPPSVIDGKAYRWVNSLEPAHFPLQISCAIHGALGRNDYLARVVSPRRRNSGMAGAELAVALQMVNAKFREPLPDSEVRKIANSADRNYGEYSPQVANRIVQAVFIGYYIQCLRPPHYWTDARRCISRQLSNDAASPAAYRRAPRRSLRAIRVALKCECGHTRTVQPQTLAGLAGLDALLPDVVKRLRCSRCGRRRCSAMVRPETKRDG
jgi:hypothetical protein